MVTEAHDRCQTGDGLTTYFQVGDETFRMQQRIFPSRMMARCQNGKSSSMFKKSPDAAPTPVHAHLLQAHVNGPNPAGSGGSAPETRAEGVVIIGKGTRIVGEITDCSRLEIQGSVEGTIVADTLVLRHGGGVKGRLQARHAEVHGDFNGILEVQDLLDVHSTGRVEGELAYGKLSVAMGGHISGNIISPQTDVVSSDQGGHHATDPGQVPVAPIPASAMSRLVIPNIVN